jgi:hypothetical protein
MIDQQFINLSSQQALVAIEQRRPTQIDALFTVKNFLTPAAATKLKNYLSTVKESVWTQVAGQEKLNRKKLAWESNSIIEELHSAFNDITPAISQINNTPLNFLGVQIWKDWEGYYIQPHQDNSIIDVGLQIYLFDNNAKLGTTFVNQDHTVEIPYIHNSGYLMFTKNIGATQHGTTNLTPPGVIRYSLYLIWGRTIKIE